jgi:Tfp pilus assembly protein PilN
MIEINLIPDVKQELLNAQRTRAQVISGSILTCIIAGGVVVALVLYVFGVQTVRSALADQAIKDKSAQLAKVPDLSKMLTIQNQLGRISQLNDTKKINSRVFDVLSAVIPPSPNDVQVSKLTVDAASSTITIEGQTKAYDSMEVFKKTLDSSVIVYTQDGTQQQVKLASNISTTDISYGENSDNQKVLRFTLSFVYPDELLSAKIPLITIKLSVDGNVTDSYLGVPKSIFTERAKDITP